MAFHLYFRCLINNYMPTPPCTAGQLFRPRNQTKPWFCTGRGPTISRPSFIEVRLYLKRNTFMVHNLLVAVNNCSWVSPPFILIDFSSYIVCINASLSGGRCSSSLKSAHTGNSFVVANAVRPGCIWIYGDLQTTTHLWLEFVHAGVIYADSSEIGVDGNATFTNNAAGNDGGEKRLGQLVVLAVCLSWWKALFELCFKADKWREGALLYLKCTRRTCRNSFPTILVGSSHGKTMWRNWHRVLTLRPITPPSALKSSYVVYNAFHSSNWAGHLLAKTIGAMSVLQE